MHLSAHRTFGLQANRSLPQISSHRVQRCAAASGFREAGPKDPPPKYESIDNQPLNQAIMALFRNKLVQFTGGQDSSLLGYSGVIDLTRKLHRIGSSPRDTQVRTRELLQSLFPPWLFPFFRAMFAQPMPELSRRLNAWATVLTCQWLMGPCKVIDVEIDGKVQEAQGILIERCRFLEESGCASVCTNCCQQPTQEFFAKDMGIVMAMEPNFDDFSCKYYFGKTPQPKSTDPAFNSPCFTQCPSKALKQAAPGTTAAQAGEKVCKGMDVARY